MRKPRAIELIILIFFISLCAVAMALGWGELEKSIKSTIEGLKLGRHSIESEWSEGVLTVTGYVGSGDEKERVGEALAALDGVKNVDNQLEVRVDLYSASPSTLDLRKNVLDTIGKLSGLGLHEISVFAQGEKIMLSGSTASQKDRDRIESAVKSIPGVSELENRITVIKGPDDEKITENVWTALKKEKDLDLNGIAVSTDSGIVTVKGVQQKHRTLDRILSIANMADGVKEVKSEVNLSR